MHDESVNKMCWINLVWNCQFEGGFAILIDFYIKLVISFSSTFFYADGV